MMCSSGSSIALVKLQFLFLQDRFWLPSFTAKRSRDPVTPSRVMKKGKKSENRSDSEAKRPTILVPNGVFHHPARVDLTHI